MASDTTSQVGTDDDATAVIPQQKPAARASRPFDYSRLPMQPENLDPESIQGPPTAQSDRGKVAAIAILCVVITAALAGFAFWLLS